MFDDDDLDIFFEDFGLKATFRLSGADVNTVDCIHNPSTEMVSPHTAEMALLRPELWFKGADLEGITKEHSVLVFDEDSGPQTGIEYKQHGQPKPEGPFTRIMLVKK